MTYEKKLIQHKILNELQKRLFKFHAPDKKTNEKLQPNISSIELSELLNISLEETESYSFELVERGLVNFSQPPFNYCISDDGITAFKSERFLSEAKELRIQSEFTEASMKVSKSVIDTNAMQRKATILTVLIAALALIVSILTLIITFCK